MAKKTIPSNDLEDQFPSNSRFKKAEENLPVRNDREDLPNDEIVDNQENIKDPIAKAKIKKKRKKRKNTVFSFIYREGKEILLYLWEDVLIPGIKETVQSGLENGIEMMFNGPDEDYRGSRTRRRSGEPRIISYNDYFQSDSRKSRRMRPTRERRRTSKLDGISFEFIHEARQVLNHLKNIQEEYGCVSVSDYLEASGLTENIEAVDSVRGWDESIQRASISRTRDNDFIINLPRTISIS